MSTEYQHHVNGKVSTLPVGKVVCVGRNYVAHAKELNNPVPTEPLLFIKPANTLTFLTPSFSIPASRGECHFEIELAVLIDKKLTMATEQEAQSAIAGIGLALDLTLRDLQQQLKEKGQPWEKAKAFDGACPVSGFVTAEGIDLQNLSIRLWQNGQSRQNGNSADMLVPVVALLSYASTFFTIMPGDILLTGTPQGVGPLHRGDRLTLELSNLLNAESLVL